MARCAGSMLCSWGAVIFWQQGVLQEPPAAMVFGPNGTCLYAGDSQETGGIVAQIAVLSYVALMRIGMAFRAPIASRREGSIEIGGFSLVPLGYGKRRVFLGARLVTQ